MLTRDQILAAKDRESEIVNVPEWGGDVRVAVLSGAGRERVQAAAGGGIASLSKFSATLLAASLIDEEGAPLFTEEDVAALSEKNPEVISRVLEVSIRLSKLGVSATEDAEKNSEAAPKNSSGSISQKN
jgi:hypothetical protein